MPKQKDGSESQVTAPATREFFYPPQDGRDAFVCEASSQEEADAKYRSEALEK